MARVPKGITKAAYDKIMSLMKKGEAAEAKAAYKETFLPKDLYHGTVQDVKGFDLKKSGMNTGQKENAVFLSDSPDIANQYAQDYLDRVGRSGSGIRQEIKALRTQMQKAQGREASDIASLIRAKNDELAEVISKTPNPEFDGANVLPVKARMANPKVVDNIRVYSPLEVQKAIKLAKKEGHDGVIFKGMDDSLRPREGANASDVYAVFNPSQVRSKFANFDPKKMSSKDLAAGAAGATLMGSGEAMANGKMKEVDVRDMFGGPEVDVSAAFRPEEVDVREAIEGPSVDIGHLFKKQKEEPGLLKKAFMYAMDDGAPNAPGDDSLRDPSVDPMSVFEGLTGVGYGIKKAAAYAGKEALKRSALKNLIGNSAQDLTGKTMPRSVIIPGKRVPKRQFESNVVRAEDSMLPEIPTVPGPKDQMMPSYGGKLSGRTDIAEKVKEGLDNFKLTEETTKLAQEAKTVPIDLLDLIEQAKKKKK